MCIIVELHIFYTGGLLEEQSDFLASVLEDCLQASFPLVCYLEQSWSWKKFHKQFFILIWVKNILSILAVLSFQLELEKCMIVIFFNLASIV